MGWFCCQCGDGTYTITIVCTSCGHDKCSCCIVDGHPYYGATEVSEKADLPNDEQCGAGDYLYSEMALPWHSLEDSTWVEPLMHVGLFSLASVAALDVGGEYGAWSSMPWSPLTNCYEPLTVDHSDVHNEIYCGGHTIVSTIAFAAAATTVHHLRRNDCCQDVCLFASITCGVAIGLCLGNNLHDMMFSILPWAILTGLLCSILIHRFWNCRKCILDEKC